MRLRVARVRRNYRSRAVKKSRTSAKAERSGRTRPDGVTLAWETADVGPGPRGSFFPFLIRDLTPREKRVYPSGTPTEKRFSGIGLVVIGVSNLDEAIAQ